MKKTFSTLHIVALLFLQSCSNSISGDARQIAELQCKVMELQQKALAGGLSNSEESSKLMVEASALLREMSSVLNTPQSKKKRNLKKRF